MKKKIQQKMAQSQWRWDNIAKAAGGLVLLTVAILGLVLGCRQPEVKAIEAKVTIYDVPIDLELLDHISGLSADYEIPVEIILAVIEKESSFNEKAVSAVGAKGLMQIIPEYHKDRMKRLGCNDLFDPKQNVTVGVDFLAELIKKNGGNLHKALTAYNYGQNGANDKFFSKGKESSSYSESVIETAANIEKGMIEMNWTDNPVRDYDRHCDEQEKWLENLPQCVFCSSDEHIQDDHYYLIDGDIYCEEHMIENFRKNVEDFVE